MKKKLAAWGFAALTMMMVGCTSSTAEGPCVGIGDAQDPALVYKPSVQNIVVAILFFELVLPPVFVAVDQFYCPVGRK